MIVMVMVMLMGTIHSYRILSYSLIRKQHRAHRTKQKAAQQTWQGKQHRGLHQTTADSTAQPGTWTLFFLYGIHRSEIFITPHTAVSQSQEAHSVSSVCGPWAGFFFFYRISRLFTFFKTQIFVFFHFFSLFSFFFYKNFIENKSNG